MAAMDANTKARRLEALRLARISSAMEGLDEHPEDAAALDAYAAGDIDRAELERRVFARIARRHSKVVERV